jgi:hypothetical protein
MCEAEIKKYIAMGYPVVIMLDVGRCRNTTISGGLVIGLRLSDTTKATFTFQIFRVTK